MLGVLRDCSLWNPCQFRTVGWPRTFQAAVPHGGGVAPILHACACSSSLSFQFSGFWYEIAFASKPQTLAPELRKMGAVLVELEEGHLALTTAYEE